MKTTKVARGEAGSLRVLASAGVSWAAIAEASAEDVADAAGALVGAGLLAGAVPSPAPHPVSPTRSARPAPAVVNVFRAASNTSSPKASAFTVGAYAERGSENPRASRQRMNHILTHMILSRPFRGGRLGPATPCSDRGLSPHSVSMRQ